MSVTSSIPTFTRGVRALGRAVKWTGRILWRPPYRHILGWPIVGIVIAILIFNWQVSRKWAAYREAAAARGVALNRPAPGPAVADSENFAAISGPFGYRDATTFDFLDFTGISLDLPNFSIGKRMTVEKAYGGVFEELHLRKARRQAFKLPAEITPEHTAEGFIAYFDRHFETQWPAILEAEARPKTQYRLPEVLWSEGSQEHPLSYAAARGASQLHCMRGMALLELGRDEEALAEVRGICRIAREMHAGGELNLIHSMIETAITGLTLADIWEGLVDQRWSDADLVALQGELASFAPMKEWAEIVQGERNYENAIFDKMASDSVWERVSDCRMLFSDNQWSRNPAGGGFGLCPTGMIRESQLVANQYMDAASQWIDSDGRWHPEKYREVNYDQLISFRHFLAAKMVPSGERASKRVVAAEAWLHEGSTALALERYRLRHHDLPERLDALVPEFLPAIPVDPVNGESVKYARESAESYRLWCVGEYAGGSLRDVCETAKIDGHDMILWPGLAPEKDAPAVAAR
jgi:hypothetical protein